MLVLAEKKKMAFLCVNVASFDSWATVGNNSGVATTETAGVGYEDDKAHFVPVDSPSGSRPTKQFTLSMFLEFGSISNSRNSFVFIIITRGFLLVGGNNSHGDDHQLSSIRTLFVSSTCKAT